MLVHTASKPSVSMVYSLLMTFWHTTSKADATLSKTSLRAPFLKPLCQSGSCSAQVCRATWSGSSDSMASSKGLMTGVYSISATLHATCQHAWTYPWAGLWAGPYIYEKAYVCIIRCLLLMLFLSGSFESLSTSSTTRGKAWGRACGRA